MLAAIILIALAVYPPQSPEPPRTSQSHSAQRARKADQPQQSNPPPAATPEPSPAIHQASASKNTADTEQRSSEVGIQRKLVWFTGLLVLVGAAQTVVMFLQWRIYRRQAREMRRQRHEMIRQRRIMAGQWHAMTDQAKLMEGQLKAIENQTAILNKSVDAAEKSADAAKENVELFINKERARLRVELKPLDLSEKHKLGGLQPVDFIVSIYGPTAAFVTDSGCTAYYLPLQYIAEEEVGSAVISNIMLLPKIIAPNTEPTEHLALLLFDGQHEKEILDEIKNDRLFVGLRGFIRYRDVFDRERETTFRYVWKYDRMYGLDSDYGHWEKCGTPEENRET